MRNLMRKEVMAEPGYFMVPHASANCVGSFMRQMRLVAERRWHWKSKARLLPARRIRSLSRWAGIDEARKSWKRSLISLKAPKKFTKLGGRIPKGVLLVGRQELERRFLQRLLQVKLMCLF